MKLKSRIKKSYYQLLSTSLTKEIRQLGLFSWTSTVDLMKITLMRIKNLRLREKYGEGEVPYEAKTGSGAILLTFRCLMYVIG